MGRHNLFWDRWISEYLILIQQRSKWASACNIAEDSTAPGPREFHPYSDGAVRVVTIKNKTGDYKRIIHRICPVPVDD